MVKKEKVKTVVLTFDDGPSKVLLDILDVLWHQNVPAVFFWQSRLLYDQRPWQRVLDEGHDIGTHSRKHLNLTKLSYKEQFQDIASSKSKIEQITKHKIKYFRPPFGQFNEDTMAVAKTLGLTPVMWRISSMDWELKDNPQKIITNVLEHLEDGAIILLHELKQTLEALPELITEIKAKGFHFRKI
ncbi:polysaccharide deacetylase family protein [Alkalihalobacillus sp. BA299]|uniref:polysaccharide deacetylase family protein n=1 Tax=Alkalihalobacillus sp. BA299 TaxID=2815938 RepID=UPI001ADBC538|nr:polysaccharide deacetylase family protein [Alkalihalobacillus sp. BA299]